MNTRAIRTASDIKTMVQGGKQVRFTRFQSGQLWYSTECGFEFPVPVEEVGQTPYLAQDKALLFMRFIRKHIQHIQSAMAAESENLDPPATNLHLC